MRSHTLLLLLAAPAFAWQPNMVDRLQGYVVQASNNKPLPVKVNLRIPQCRPDVIDLDQNGHFQALCSEALPDGRYIHQLLDAPGWEVANPDILQTEAHRPPYQLGIRMRPIPKPIRRPSGPQLKGPDPDDALKASVAITGDRENPLLTVAIAEQKNSVLGVRDLIIYVDHVGTVPLPLAPIDQHRNLGNDANYLLLPTSGTPNRLQRRIPDGSLKPLENKNVVFHLVDDSTRGDREQLYVVRIEIAWVKDEVEHRRMLGPFSFVIAGPRNASIVRTTSQAEAQAMIAADQQELRSQAVSAAELSSALAALRSKVLALQIQKLDADLDLSGALARASRDAIRVLLLAGIETQVKWDAIFSAVRAKEWDGIAAILDVDETLDVNARIRRPPDINVIQQAAIARRTDVVKKLIAKGEYAQPALKEAAGAADAEMVREILDAGIIPDSDAFCGAAHSGAIPILRLLLRKAPVPDRCRYTSILETALAGRKPEVLKWVVTNGAFGPSLLAETINSMMTRNQLGFDYFALHTPEDLPPDVAASVASSKAATNALAQEFLQILVDAHPLPSLITGEAVAASPMTAAILVKAGVDVNTDRGKALQTALERKDTALCNALLELGAAKIELSVDALFEPIMKLKVELVECLVRSGADINQTFREMNWKNYDSVPFPIGTPGLTGWTPLMLAASGAFSKLHRLETTEEKEARAKRSSEIVKMLLRSGANSKVKTSAGQNALSIAWEYQNFQPPLVEALLEAGADPNVRSSDGDTPLIHFIDYPDRQFVRLLLDHQADPNLPDGKGRTPLKAAADKTWRYTLSDPKDERAQRLEIRKMLLAAGARK